MTEIQELSDDELTDRLRLLVIDEKRCSAAVVAHLAEFRRRRLAEEKGYPSLFVYCRRELGFSEDEAYKRIQAAGAAQRFPSIIGRLERGQITLKAVVLLAPHLTGDNHRSLLDWARGRGARELEAKLAELAPRAAPADAIRHLGPKPAAASTVPAEDLFRRTPPSSEAAADTRGGAGALQRVGRGGGSLTPGEEAGKQVSSGPDSGASRVRFAFTGDERLLASLERAKALLRHKYPAGRFEEVLSEVLAFYLARKDPSLKPRPAARRPRGPRRRRIPQWVKDAVFKRDGGACAFLAKEGRRCGERGFLEYDHVTPWAEGGASDDPANVRLLCRAHNQALARPGGCVRVGARPGVSAS